MVKYGLNLYHLKLNRPRNIQPVGLKPAKSNQLVKSNFKHFLLFSRKKYRFDEQRLISLNACANPIWLSTRVTIAFAITWFLTAVKFD